MIRYCVLRLKMTAPQVLEFSKLWPRPFYDEQGVWRRLEGLGLEAKVKRVPEQSLHDLWTYRVCLKIWKDATRGGHVLSEVEKECRIGEESGIRADMKFRLGDRLFYLETQQSALTFRGWKSKLSKYVRYRTRKGVLPFRVLIVMENERNLNTVYRYCREVTEGRPNLSLFLLAWQNDLLGHFDVCAEKVWVSNVQVERRPQTVSLLG